MTLSIRLGLSLAILAGAPCAWGENAPDPQDLRAIEQQLSDSKARQADLKGNLEALKREADSISAQLVSLARKTTSQEASISSAEERLKSLAKEEVTIRAGLAEKHDVLSELLAGLQRLELNPPPALVVEPNDVLSALRGAMAFGAIVPELRGEAEQLRSKLERLGTIRAEIAEDKENLKAQIVKLESTRADLEELQARKRALMAEAGESLAAERARAAELAKKAETLQELAAALEAERKKAEEQKAAALAAEQKRQEALRQKPRMAFADAKRKVEYPAQGRIVKKFGDTDGFGGKVKGVFVATRAQAQVLAPADGHIEFAGPFRSYGKLVILNAGGGYRLLLAGMGETTAETGQFVRAGEPVARMGETAAPGTLTGDHADKSGPVLYIEFRRNGDAIDPSPWWIGGAQEARG
jgi:septal ring factor EnvC (AmiA/AmiB activator)